MVMAPKTSLKRKANVQAAPKAKKVQLDQSKSSSKPEKKRSRPVTALAPPEVSGTESEEEDEEEVLEDAMDDDEGDWEDDDGQDDAMEEDEPNESNKPPKDPNGMFWLLVFQSKL
jgi:pumilio homology domain family member 6